MFKYYKIFVLLVILVITVGLIPVVNAANKSSLTAQQAGLSNGKCIPGFNCDKSGKACIPGPGGNCTGKCSSSTFVCTDQKPNEAMKQYFLLKSQGKLLSQQIKAVPAPKINVTGTNCENKLSTDASGNINYTNPSFTYITRADISDDPKFSTFYAKMLFSAPNKKWQTSLNKGFYKYAQGKKAESLKVNWGKTYYVRLYNGKYSQSSTFSIPECQQVILSENPLFQGSTTQKVYLKNNPAYFKHTFADKNPGDSLLVYAKFIRKDGKEQNAYPFPLLIQYQPCPSGNPSASGSLSPKSSSQPLGSPPFAIGTSSTQIVPCATDFPLPSVSPSLSP